MLTEMLPLFSTNERTENWAAIEAGTSMRVVHDFMILHLRELSENQESMHDLCALAAAVDKTTDGTFANYQAAAHTYCKARWPLCAPSVATLLQTSIADFLVNIAMSVRSGCISLTRKV